MNPGLLLLIGAGLGCAFTLITIGMLGLSQSFRASKNIRLHGNSEFAPRAVNHDVLS